VHGLVLAVVGVGVAIVLRIRRARDPKLSPAELRST
jgi:hypothetical protein